MFRWGDAPVHSIAVGLFLNKSEVHFFNDVGYKHEPFMHCPVARELQKKCHCNAEDNFGKHQSNCEIYNIAKWIPFHHRSYSKFLYASMGRNFVKVA
jgi:alpha 1,2-mannosyltransferase